MDVDNGKASPQAKTLEEMTVIDEVIDDSEKKDSVDSTKQDSVSVCQCPKVRVFS